MKKIVSRLDIVMVQEPDGAADTSYLEQVGFEDRLQQYRNGSFGFMGVRAEVFIKIPHGEGYISQRITSPGLWSIEDDSDPSYLGEVFKEETEVLIGMLNELGFEVLGEA